MFHWLRHRAQNFIRQKLQSRSCRKVCLPPQTLSILYSLTDSILNSEDGVASTFRTALPNLLSLESTLSDFVLLSEKFVVAPSVIEGDKAGEVF